MTYKEIEEMILDITKEGGFEAGMFSALKTIKQLKAEQGEVVAEFDGMIKHILPYGAIIQLPTKLFNDYDYLKFHKVKIFKKG